MTTTINASPSNGIVQTADGSGVMKLQSNGVTTNALAWVNFNGTSAAIRASYNVTSVTANATGDFTVNITTALADANYSYVVSQNGNYGIAQTYSASLNTSTPGTLVEVAPTTTAFRFTTSTAVGAFNPKYVNVIVFGN
jgi:alpha-acetolactate decarboxylase